MCKRMFQLMGVWMLLSLLAMGQSGPRITGVEPTTCGAGDTVIVTGEGLGEGSVEAVLLSNGEENHSAEIVDRANDRIAIKVPEVGPATYRLALQVGGVIYAEPVHITVE